MPKFALLLIICFLLCSCSHGQENTFETESETETHKEEIILTTTASDKTSDAIGGSPEDIETESQTDSASAEAPETETDTSADDVSDLKAELRFDGIYYCDEGRYASYVRFFPDGDLIHVSSTDTPEEVILWFDKSWEERGYYELDEDNIVFFEETQLGTVDYSGIVTVDGLSLDFISHINDNSGHVEYIFQETE